MSAKRHLAISAPPRSSRSAFDKIREIIHLGIVPFPEGKSFKGTGAPGRLLEHLLEVDENNRDSPDLLDWEIKYHGGGTLITLFHKDPEPRGIIRNLVHEHGWVDAEGRISFRHTLSGESERGFYVVNDPDRIWVRNRFVDTVNPYWRHNTLLNAIGAKLRRLIVVDGEVVTHPVRGVRYKRATAYWEFHQLGFFNALVKGVVAIDFDARTKGDRGTALRNHGTKFRIHSEDLASLYEFSRKIT